MVSTRWVIGLGTCAVLLYVFLGGMNLYWGDLNQDEGWYLYAARQIAEGHVVFRDFAFSQGPVFPLVYSLANSWVDRWGIAGGRLFTALLGLVAACLGAAVAARTAPARWGRAAALLAFILAGVSVYQSYFTTIVKTYALCSAFLMAGVLALCAVRGRHGGAAAMASGLLIALAAGTRISTGIALPVIFIYLILRRREVGDSRWFLFGAGGAVGLLLWSLPFVVVAPEAFRFWMLEYHTARSVGGLVPLLVFKVGFVSRLLQAFFVPLCLWVAVVLVKLLRPGTTGMVAAPDHVPSGLRGVLWTVLAAITLVHFSAPFPYEDYQVAVMPLFAAVLGGAMCAVIAGFTEGRDGALAVSWTRWLLAMVLLASAAASFSSPINQNWVIAGRDRIWWKLRKEAPLKVLHDVSLWIGKQVPVGECMLLTQDTYIAVESGLTVPQGLEMGPFSYFPDMPRERAEKLRVLNREMLEELLRTAPASMAAFSGYGLAIRAPEVSQLSADEQMTLWTLVGENYGEICEVPDFGQSGTMLKIFRRRDRETPGS